MRSRSCATVENYVSLFMTVMDSVSFRCRWRLFYTLIALVPMHMWARMVHSIPPLPGSSCQLHSRQRRYLTASLYLRIFSSGSASKRRTRSSCAEAWVHFSSGGPTTLMLSGRSGGTWFLAWTRICFRSFLFCDRKGQTLALQKSCPASTGIVATPLWVKCEDETHTPKSGNLESSRTTENSELEFRGQNTSH